MKVFTVWSGRVRIGWVAIIWLSTMALLPPAVAGFFTEDFEAYTLPTNVMEIGNGWSASSNTVAVRSVASTNEGENTHAADITAGEFMANQVSTNASRIWTEAWLNGTNFLTPDTTPPVNTAAVFMVGVSTNGCLTFCNPTSLVWDVCATDATNGPPEIIQTGIWARVSVFQNYGNHKVAIFLKDHLIVKELPFINTNNGNYATLRFDSAREGNVHVDNVVVGTNTPPGLVSDSDGDGRFDAEEFTLLGTLTNWEGSVITAVVSNGVTVTGTGTVSQAIAAPTPLGRVHWQGQTTCSMTGAIACAVDRVWTNGDLAQTYSNKTAQFAWTNITTDGTLVALFYYDGIRYVSVSGDYSSITDAVAAARSGDRIIIDNGLRSETVSISSNLTLAGTNLTGLTGLMVRTGATVTVSGFSNFSVSGVVQVDTNGVLVVSNGVADLGTLVLQEGATVRGYNSTATVNGVLYSGNFILSNNWEVAIRPQALNLSDGFENYATNSRLDRLVYYGWGASDSNVTVVANPDVAGNTSAHAAGVPPGRLVSNWVDGVQAGLSNIWTDVLIRGSKVELPEQIDTNGAAPVMFFVNTSGYLTVLTPAGWVVCSQDVSGAQAPTIAVGEWASVSWHMDFGSTTAAYFVKGRLVRQLAPFAKSAANYHGLRLNANADAAWLDAVNIQTNVPAGLTNNGAIGDSDSDGISDAQEIQLCGNTLAFPRGSVFKIR